MKLLTTIHIQNHLNECKQIVMLNEIFAVTYQYLKPFNYMQKMSPGSFKNVTNTMCLQIIYILYILM